MMPIERLSLRNLEVIPSLSKLLSATFGHGGVPMLRLTLAPEVLYGQLRFMLDHAVTQVQDVILESGPDAPIAPAFKSFARNVPMPRGISEGEAYDILSSKNNQSKIGLLLAVASLLSQPQATTKRATFAEFKEVMQTVSDLTSTTLVLHFGMPDSGADLIPYIVDNCRPSEMTPALQAFYRWYRPSYCRVILSDGRYSLVPATLTINPKPLATGHDRVTAASFIGEILDRMMAASKLTATERADLERQLGIQG